MDQSKERKGSDELPRTQTLLWGHIFNHMDSMALKCAVELGIPDAIAGRSSSDVTIPELISALSLSPSKTPHMRRLMRMLTHSGIFACSRSRSSREDAYSLTPLSQLLVEKKADTSLSGFLRAMLHPILVDPFRSMSDWFRGDEATPFSVTHNCRLWDMTKHDAKFNEVFNEGMASDTQFFMGVLLNECGRVFQGLKSLMDVGGGNGSTAAAITKVFPEVKCSVFELPQVIDAIHDKGGIEFIAGDMFEYVPPANAVLLKCILHDWDDEDCVKILRRCKEAIPSKEDGGKVIIIDLVVSEENNGPDRDSRTTQLYWDMMMMVLCGGNERREEEWKKLFTEAGFVDYKITTLGLRSVIEVYP